MSARDFALLRAKMHDALGKSGFLGEMSSSSCSSESDSKWSERTPRRAYTNCNNWALILIPLLFLSVVVFYFVIVDVGLVSTILEEQENKSMITKPTFIKQDDSFELPSKTVPSFKVITTTTKVSKSAEEEASTSEIFSTSSSISAEAVTTQPTTKSSTTVFTTRATMARKPVPQIKISKTNSTLVILKKDDNGTRFVLGGARFHPKDFLEVINPPNLREVEKKVLDNPPLKPLTTPRGFNYSPTVPLVARLQAERADTTTALYNDTNDVACFSPRIPFCEGILPYDMVQLPSIPDINSVRDLDSMLPYFQLILQSGCSQRAKEFICAVLEPECQPVGVKHPAPCKVNCKVVAEDCKDFILETLPLSRIFDCRRYPDWDENQECINLSKGTCFRGEFQCPDGSCIPSKWTCDGLHDCPGSRPAADEHNCSGCAAHEFRCILDGKCVPGHWQCDGESDCIDNSDESSC